MTERRHVAMTTFLEEMSGATEAPLSVDIDPDLECVRLNIYCRGRDCRPQRLFMHPHLALRVAMDLGANCERLRLLLAKRLEEEKP